MVLSPNFISKMNTRRIRRTYYTIADVKDTTASDDEDDTVSLQVENASARYQSRNYNNYSYNYRDLAEARAEI